MPSSNDGAHGITLVRLLPASPYPLPDLNINHEL